MQKENKFFFSFPSDSNFGEAKVTMFADANDQIRLKRHHSRGLRAPCREAPPRCVFHSFLGKKLVR